MLQIKVVDRSNVSKSIIHDVLKLQKTLVKTKDTANGNTGFLISLFKLHELLELVSKQEGLLICAYDSNKLIGYLLKTSISEFENLVNNAQNCRFAPNSPISYENLDYLYQIASHPAYRKNGISRLLFSSLLQNTNKNILTDVLIDPVRNTASLNFFYKLGFKKHGLICLSSYRDFGALVSEVFIFER